jgi:hypothetical protein
MMATNNISTHLRDDRGATFCNSVVLVEGRCQASNAEVVMGDLSATPNPLTAHADNNLLSPFCNIRAIPSKLCSRLSLAIIEGYRLNLARCAGVAAARSIRLL